MMGGGEDEVQTIETQHAVTENVDASNDEDDRQGSLVSYGTSPSQQTTRTPKGWSPDRADEGIVCQVSKQIHLRWVGDLVVVLT